MLWPGELDRRRAFAVCPTPPGTEIASRAVSHLTHVALRGRDIGRSLVFYVGKLRLEEMLRIERNGLRGLVYPRITDDHYLELFPDGVGERAPAADVVSYNGPAPWKVVLLEGGF